jgi:hypothetical protein
MARQAELADQEHVKRRPKRARDLIGDRNPASRQGEHDNVVTVRKVFESPSELCAGFTAIVERLWLIEVGRPAIHEPHLAPDCRLVRILLQYSRLRETDARFVNGRRNS